MVNILGISCYFHDAAAAIVKDGIVIAAAEEERFTRKKHDFSFPINAINFCLKKSGTTADGIDYVVFYEKPFNKFERILQTTLQTFPHSLSTFREAMVSWMTEKMWIRGLIHDKTGVPESKILFCDHHMSHAANSFFCSPFNEAAIVTIDAVGEWATTTYGIGRDTDIELQKEIRFPHSLGLFYSAFTSFLGFEVNEGEYKVMGLAPYGKPCEKEKIMSHIDTKSDGSFAINMKPFTWHNSIEKMFNSKFTKLYGQQRTREESERLNTYCSNLAASVQQVTEDAVVKIVKHVKEKTGMKNLCLSGGVAYNSKANGRIMRECGFENIFIPPASGDSGSAIGAALYVYHTLLGNNRKFVMKHAYWGQEYEENLIKEFLDSNNIPYQRTSDNDLFQLVSEEMQRGKVIGWYQGRFEWGPRALGNRSIIADPRKQEMKDIVNMKIKFREPFRPFAPSVLADECENFFELRNAKEQWPARFMLYVVDVNANKRSTIPAITHVDGTARLQTVFKEENPRYYNLIKTFQEHTGVPLILNTSFNLRGEPIVDSPADAYSDLIKSGLDMIVLENFIVRKDDIKG